MQKYCWYCLILSLIFTGCQKGGPCQFGGVPYCVGTYYGATRLQDSTKYWIPPVLSKNIKYISSTSGKSDSFTLSDRYQLIYKDVFVTHALQTPCGMAYCDDYCDSEHEIVKFTPVFYAPYSVELKRDKDYYENLNSPSSEIVKNSKDRMIVNIRSTIDTSVFSFKVLMNKKDNSTAGYKYYDSMQLGTHYQHSVYEVFINRPNQPNIYIKGIYYNTENGLVGYYLNTNEVWYLQ